MWSSFCSGTSYRKMREKNMRSQLLFEEAESYLVGGVNSPVRAFRGVGGTPIFFKRAEGAYLYDEDEREYVDYVGSWGPMILGHAHPLVIQTVIEHAKNGLSFGAPCQLEIQLAKKINALMPSLEKIRMTNSGTEAVMSAIRLARGFTHRNKIIKFAGGYHGHADFLLVKAGSGALTCGSPDSAGVPENVTEHTLIADYNRLDTVKKLCEIHGDDIAAIIVEPVAGNMNCILPSREFLAGLRTLCDEYGSLLIFDEVMTGFRVALGGAQAHFKIKPDLTTLGKIIGGGMPVGALGGRADIMECLAPLGSVYQAGTLSGNPIAMAAGLKTLELISEPGFYDTLSRMTCLLAETLLDSAKKAGIPFQMVCLGGMFGLFFTEENKIETYDDVKKSNAVQFKKFFHGMVQEGIYFAPSAYEAGFMSIAHGEAEIEKTRLAAMKTFSKLL